MAREPISGSGDRDRQLLHRRTAVKLPLLLAGGAALSRAPRAAASPSPQRGRWSADRANTWYRAQGWLVGANFITSNAVNQLEMFGAETFDTLRIDNELRLARTLGFNTVRVFLHDQLWAQNHLAFHIRLAQFVSIAARRNIKPLFVLFDSCWDPLPRLGRQRDPRPGVHNSGWVQSPGAERLADPNYAKTLRDYVVAVLTQFRTDPRVLGWDLWNEPDNPAAQYRDVEMKVDDKERLVEGMLPQVFNWARSVAPVQPLTSGVWQGKWADPRDRSPIARIQLDNSDVITFHSYAKPADFDGRVDELLPLGRPILCTEYLARSLGSTVEGILPITKRRNVAAYNWGLVAGKTQTYYPWDSWERPYPDIPNSWFSDLLKLNGRPHQDDDIQAFLRLTGRLGPR